MDEHAVQPTPEQLRNQSAEDHPANEDAADAAAAAVDPPTKQKKKKKMKKRKTQQVYSAQASWHDTTMTVLEQFVAHGVNVQLELPRAWHAYFLTFHMSTTVIN